MRPDVTQPGPIAQHHLFDYVASFPLSKDPGKDIRSDYPLVEDRPVSSDHEPGFRSSGVNSENPHQGITNRIGIIAQDSTGCPSREAGANLHFTAALTAASSST